MHDETRYTVATGGEPHAESGVAGVGRLSPLQRRVWQIVTGLPEAETVALAGAGGLIVRGVVDRSSRDVDLFTTDADEVDRLLPALQEAMAAEGFDVEVVRHRWGLVSLQVQGMGQATGVDIGTQIRLNPTERTADGAILSLDDLAGGKFIALTDRGAVRDYIDVAALTSEYTFAELCDLTEARQPRFDRQRLARRLRQFPRLKAEQFGSIDRYDEIRRKVADWLHGLIDR